MNLFRPTVDQWYARRDKGEMFRVVAIDSQDGAVDIQNFDGDLEELEREAWRALEIEPAEAPQNWTGPLDDIEPEDLGDTETAMRPAEWREPLQLLRSEEEPWQDARQTDERDEDEPPAETS